MNRLDTLREMEARQPADAFVKYAIALEYLALGQDDEALKYFEGVKQQFPAYVGVYLHLGKLYEKLGQTDKSLATYKAGIEVAKRANDKKAHEELAEALLLASDE